MGQGREVIALRMSQEMFSTANCNENSTTFCELH